VITGTGIDSDSQTITVVFNDTMVDQELTNSDLSITISGTNGPYTVDWSADFDSNKLVITFKPSPSLMSGGDFSLSLYLTNVGTYIQPLNYIYRGIHEFRQHSHARYS
jgi:hypothetical protein